MALRTECGSRVTLCPATIASPSDASLSVARNRIVEEDHHAVAGKALQRAFVLHDEPAHLGVVLAQHGHHFLGLHRRGKRGETAQAQEADGDFAAAGLQRILGASGDDQPGQLR